MYKYYKSKHITFYKDKLSKKRIVSIGILLSIIFFALILRYSYICMYRGDKLAAMAQSQYCYEENIENLNYRVFDTNGKELIEHYFKYYAVIDPMFYLKYNSNKNADEIKDIKRALIKCNADYKLPDEINNVCIKNKIYYEIDENTYKKIINISGLERIKGFYVYRNSIAKSDKAWNIINMLTRKFDSRTGKPKKQYCLEMYIEDKVAKNKFTEIKIMNDIYNDKYNNKIVMPSDNINVKLTLDKNIQDSIKRIISNKKYDKYEEISVVLMEAKTGKIKALTQRDDSKPNLNLGVASNHGYFPGSIFKVIVEEAGLDLGIISKHDVYEYTDAKSRSSEKKNMTVEKAFITSSNDVFYQIGEEVGFDNIYRYAYKQGLLNTVLNLYDEQNGNFEVIENNITVDQVRQAAIGQKIRITPVEALSIPSTVVNNGIYVRPYIIEGFVDSNNNYIEKEHSIKRRVMKKSTAKILKEQMQQVVNSHFGTGRNAKISGINMGGKTGTTEYYEIDDHNKRQKYSDGWFVGFFEHNKKIYSMVVLVRKININTEEASNTAVPIFKEIVEELIKSKYV
ncbi:stage V sporulation protein D [Clostridium tepidiprofundi DSM 19306]|uniref:Stage V sporulation protein D n=1 Tax=Clostridium tepidiprofundi DSM 19306 TaxID=1121338 RepID=A0A151B893_9CLOT|nr:penicillin-binding transpeptidase domain-containing protein [Clostridium tepidiprofundi]KYH35952.1 stage V sporulation protein D [Clostridium tepidiprofundi DSM 19306]